MTFLANIIQFINQNESLITVIFSGIVALSTVVYAILTARLTSETKRMRKSQTEPKIAIYLQRNRAALGFFDLVIKNIGLGPAYNVTFQVLEEFKVEQGRNLSAIDFIHEGINYMPPDYTIETFFFSIIGKQYAEIINKNIKIRVEYKNSEGKSISEIIKLNMSQFKGIECLGDDPINKIAQCIEKIQKDIHDLSTGFSRLKVERYMAEDHKRIQFSENSMGE